jgi:hypothetical protein
VTLLQHLEAQPVGLNELGLHIEHSVTFVPIQLSLGQLAFRFEPRVAEFARKGQPRWLSHGTHVSSV